MFEDLLAEVHRRKLILVDMRETDDGTWYVTLAKSQTQPALHWNTGIGKTYVAAFEKVLGIVERKMTPKPQRGDDLI